MHRKMEVKRKAPPTATIKRIPHILGDRLRLLFLLEALGILTLLACTPENLSFLKNLFPEIAVSVSTGLMGLAVRLSASRLGVGEPTERAAELDRFTGDLLIRRRPLQTLLGLCFWNLLISGIVILAGFLTLGVVPIIWMFFNLGLLGPQPKVFKDYPHCWFEASAFIVSASLGIWGGLKLNLVLGNLGLIPSTTVIFIFGLHLSAALLETLEIHKNR